MPSRQRAAAASPPPRTRRRLVERRPSAMLAALACAACIAMHGSALSAQPEEEQPEPAACLPPRRSMPTTHMNCLPRSLPCRPSLARLRLGPPPPTNGDSPSLRQLVRCAGFAMQSSRGWLHVLQYALPSPALPLPSPLQRPGAPASRHQHTRAARAAKGGAGKECAAGGDARGLAVPDASLPHAAGAPQLHAACCGLMAMLEQQGVSKQPAGAK